MCFAQKLCDLNYNKKSRVLYVMSALESNTTWLKSTVKEIHSYELDIWKYAC